MPDRDSHGRFTADHHATRTLAIGGALAALTALGVAAAAYFRNEIAARLAPEGHDASDLPAPDQPRPDAAHRAPAAFRPDIDAPMSAAEREALRPATGGSPSLVASEGSIAAS